MFASFLLIIFKSPKQSGKTYCFCSVSSSSFSYLPKFGLAEISKTTRRIVLKFGDMVDMDVTLRYSVLKFEMLDSKAGPRACPKQPKFLTRPFL